MSPERNGFKAQQWIDRLKRFGDSGQTVAEFCESEGVSHPSYYYWNKKLGTGKRAGGDKTKRRRKNRPAFKAVQLTPSIDLQQSTTIRLTAGVEIELGNNLQVVDQVIQSVVKQVLQSQATKAGVSRC